jgi:hypothetical protein
VLDRVLAQPPAQALPIRREDASTACSSTSLLPGTRTRMQALTVFLRMSRAAQPRYSRFNLTASRQRRSSVVPCTN